MKRLLKEIVAGMMQSGFAKERVREAFWRNERDVFSQLDYTQQNPPSLYAVPEIYRPKEELGLTQAYNEPPIFVTARFRAGSTFLWQMFRNISGVTSYYEPLNERRWFDSGTLQRGVDATHIGVSDYSSEYRNMEDLGEWFKAHWGFRWLYMDARHYDPDLYQYINQLILRAPGRAVLQFNRVDFRLPWLKANFPSATILHLYRSPREQWISNISKGKVIALDYKYSRYDVSGPDNFYLLEWARDLRRVFPFLEPEGQHPYALHYMIWRLSYSFGRSYAKYSVCYEELISDFQSQASQMFTALGMSQVNVDALATLNRGVEKQRAYEYADREWYESIEQECDRVLSAFFGTK